MLSNELTNGSLCEYVGMNVYLKSSLAFRWPGMAAVSGPAWPGLMDYTSNSNVQAFLAQGDRRGAQAEGHG